MNEEKTIRLDFGDKESQISPYERPVTPEILRHYKKLELSPSEKAQMSEFIEQMSAKMETEVSNHPYEEAECCIGTDGTTYVLKIESDEDVECYIDADGTTYLKIKE